MAIEDTEDDVFYLAGSKTDSLYVYPAGLNAGAYLKLIAENEEQLAEVEISGRYRLAVSLFYRNDVRDFSTLIITKIRKHGEGWRKDGEVRVNGADRSKLRGFLSLLLSLEPHSATKARIAVDMLDLNSFSSLLATGNAGELMKKIAESPELTDDIFALAHKKQALATFEELLIDNGAIADYKSRHSIRKSGHEAAWQHFFEANPWIFGHGLNYVFLGKVGPKLETATTGASHTGPGDRVDALMRTKAAVSQYVLIEIKTPGLELLGKEYRSGCWAVHPDLTDAVSQVQKTAFDFTVGQAAKVQLRDEGGWLTGDEVYRVQPKAFLVAGSLEQMRRHDDRVTCFQLFRNSLTTPEIITFDELYERTKCIVATISAERQEGVIEKKSEIDDDIPF